jgi:hypothetical protein
MAAPDLARARHLYESILPWDGAADSLKRVNDSIHRISTHKIGPRGGKRMAVTRSTSVERARNPQPTYGGGGRTLERVLLLLTSALILAAVSLTAAARIARMVGSDSERLNLSTLDRREQLLPFLQWISSPAERQYIAGKIFEGVRSGRVRCRT